MRRQSLLAQHPRVGQHLLSLLSVVTQAKYLAAQEAFSLWLDGVKVPFATLQEENQDMTLAEYVLDLRDEVLKSVQDARITVSAIQ